MVCWEKRPPEGRPRRPLPLPLPLELEAGALLEAAELVHDSELDSTELPEDVESDEVLSPEEELVSDSDCLREEVLPRPLPRPGGVPGPRVTYPAASTLSWNSRLDKSLWMLDWSGGATLRLSRPTPRTDALETVVLYDEAQIENVPGPQGKGSLMGCAHLRAASAARPPPLLVHPGSPLPSLGPPPPFPSPTRTTE